MRALLLVVAVIFALNVAYAAFLVLSELVHRWRARREVGELEAMWFADRQEAGGHARRSVGRMALAGASLLLLSGLTVVSPVGNVARNVVDHVTDAISGGSGGEQGVVAAPSEAEATGSPPVAPSVGAGASTDPSQDEREPNEDDAGTDRTATDPSQREGSSSEPVDDSSDDVEPPIETSSPTDAPEPTPIDDPSASASVSPPDLTVEFEVRSPTVVLSWGSVPSATRFEVAVFDTGENVWRQIASLPPGKRSWTSDALEPGVTYEFGVTARLAQGEPVTAEVTVPMPQA